MILEEELEMDNWLTMQAQVAAGRLIEVPPYLLGPAGRCLQGCAKAGAFTERKLTQVGSEVSRRTRKLDAPRHVQPPLLGVENGE